MLFWDLDKGWVTSDGPHPWRATVKAVESLAGKELVWTCRPRRCHVGHERAGRSWVVIRRYPLHKRWSVRLEGFEFWTHNRVLGYEHYTPVVGFDAIKDARNFVKAVLLEVPAHC